MTAQVQRLLDLLALAVLVAAQDQATATELLLALEARQVPELVAQAHRRATARAMLLQEPSPAAQR